MPLIAALGRNALVRNIKPFFPLLVYAAVALLLVLVFLSSFRQIEALILQEKLAYLGATADEKAEEIAIWRDTQTSIAESISRNSLLAAEFERWLADGAPADGRKRLLLQRLGEFHAVNKCRAMVLLDRAGRVRLSMPAAFPWGEEDVRRARKAMDSGEVLFSELHLNSAGDRSISLDLVAPLTVGGRGAGAVVLQIDPAQSLYPLILMQHLPSASGETLLVRQDGNDALYLNELRHRENSALTLRVPLSNPKLPSALAIRGELETVDGIDYRGMPVVAEMRAIPGSSWFVVSKIDRVELFGPIAQLRNWSTGIAMIYVAIGGMLVLVWLYGQKARHKLLRVQHAAAEDRAMLMQHFEYLTKYANDIIVVTDTGGNIVEANERAETAYGYTREELLRMRVVDLRDTTEAPAVFEAQARQLQAAGELRYETRSRRKDGSTFPAEVSARLITIDGAVYMQGISRDVSERKAIEEVLRKSEAMLKESQQQAHIGSWELDLVNNFLTWSDENYRIFEVDPAQCPSTYEAFLNAVHPDDREMVNEAYASSVQNRTRYSIVHRLQFPDRPLKYVREWCETFYDAAGRPLRSIGTTQDVTEQMLFQNELRDSARMIEDLYNRAPCGYHSLDKDGVITQINDTELLWLGYTRQEVVGRMNFLELLAPASRQSFHANFSQFKSIGFVHDLEYELTRNGGSTFHVSLSATAIYDAEGEYLMSRSTLFDISERKQAEKWLQESEKRFRTMANRAPILIWMADGQDTTGYRGCSFFNQQWHDFTGLTPGCALNNGWLDSVHPDDRQQCLETYRMAFGRKHPFKQEYRLCRQDGVYRWMLDSGVPRFTEDGSFVGFIGTCIDITDNKLYEEMREQVEHIGRLNIAGEMASGLAHELSQPLSAVNNYLDACLRRMTEDNWDREGLQKTVRQAQLQAERAGTIINHLKELVRKRQQKQERSMLDINAVIGDAVSFMDYELQHNFVDLSLELSAVPLILVNRIEVEQVLLNLIKNAIEAMDSSARRELRIATRATAADTVMVSVRDSGTGISADKLEMVFNPFQSSKKEGLGLGLVICRSLVENCGGRIWAEQNGDGGVEFNFTLPAWGGI